MFKIVIIAFVSLSITNAIAKEVVIKTCDTTVDVNDLGKMDMLIKIMSNNGVLSATVKQTIDGQSATSKTNASVTEGGVRAGLTGDILESDEIDNPDYNAVERLVIHAMSTTQDSELAEAGFTAGLELEKIRKATAYTFGSNEGDMGSTTIVEAKDETGKDLGSFLGGFFVSPCK